jgi:tetrachlorobenzoquinone reductase
MIKWCLENEKSWSLVYCARSRASAAYFEELLALGPNVSFHMDDSAAGSLVDLKAALANPLSGEHVYCCGPRSLMLAVEEASAHWLENSVHFEWFSAKEIAAPPGSESASGEFDVVIKSSGARFRVASDKSILETLEDQGLAVSYSCRQGVCGACETGLCGGIADHKDQLLTPKQKASQNTILLCVSRAKSSSLVLDL